MADHDGESLKRTAEHDLEQTIPGSPEEQIVLSRLRKKCSTEKEEQIVLSVYLRRKQSAKVAEKKLLAINNDHPKR